MRTVLVTPWKNVWVPQIEEEIERRGHRRCLVVSPIESIEGPVDVVIHGWASPHHGGVATRFQRDIVFCRRFELFDGETLHRQAWEHVDEIICVNTWIAEALKRNLKAMGKHVPPIHVIYNAVDTSKWTYRERDNGNRIGMACHVHPKKNLPLAIQILAELPDSYSLHIAGEIQDPCTAEYLVHMSKEIGRDVTLYGHVPHDRMDEWWEDKDYCLSTSISEGNPNNVLEAMAKGIMPVIHNWPGAINQFDPSRPAGWPGWTFEAVSDAVVRISAGTYNASVYASFVAQHYSLDNIERVVDLALGESHVRERSSQQG